MRRADPQRVRRADPQRVRRADPQRVRRADPQRVRRADPQRVRRADPQRVRKETYTCKRTKEHTQLQGRARAKERQEHSQLQARTSYGRLAAASTPQRSSFRKGRSRDTRRDVTRIRNKVQDKDQDTRSRTRTRTRGPGQGLRREPRRVTSSRRGGHNRNPLNRRSSSDQTRIRDRCFGGAAEQGKGGLGASG